MHVHVHVLYTTPRAYIHVLYCIYVYGHIGTFLM